MRNILKNSCYGGFKQNVYLNRHLLIPVLRTYYSSVSNFGNSVLYQFGNSTLFQF